MKSIDILPFELEKLGLDEKESRLYLLALELGQFGVQEISHKAEISRPTTYRILQSLEKKKLISKFQKDKKKFFSVNSPDQFLSVLKVERRKAEEKEREFLRIISILQTKFSKNDNNDIRIFQGTEGKNNLLETLGTTHSNELFVIFFKNKKNERKLLEKTYKEIKTRRGNIFIKELHFEKLPPQDSKLNYVSKRIIKHQPFKNIPAEILIISKSITILEKDKGLRIKNSDIVEIIRSFLKIIWSQA